MAVPPGFEVHALDDEHEFLVGELPAHLVPDEAGFEDLWSLHPHEYHEIHLMGRNVLTPRWQQPYGADYHYTGRVHRALPLPESLAALLTWSRTTIDERLNGALVIWYDADLGHYIGKHRDSTKHLVTGAPIVTISLGAERVFRLRPWRGRGFRDFPTSQGRVFVMPFATNLAWTHEVPRRRRDVGRRISVTFRAFEHGVLKS